MPRGRPESFGASPTRSHGRSPGRVAARPFQVGLNWALPSFVDVIFLSVLFVCLSRADRMISADGDPARLLTIGEHILATGSIPRADLFSHSLAGQPFIAYEWLAGVASATSHRLLGLAGPALLHAALIAATFAVLFIALRARGHGLLVSLGVVLLAAAASMLAWVARPQVYTFLGAVLCWWVLDAWHRGHASARALWVLPPLFALWANLHGGYFVGWVLLGAYLAEELFRSAAPDPTTLPGTGRLRQLAPPAAASLVAPLANPYGPEMLVHTLGFFQLRYILDRTDDFLSPNFHTAGPQLFLLMLLLTMVAAAWSHRRPRVHEVAIWVGFTASALFAVRNVPLFAIAVAPMLAAQLEALPGLPPLWEARTQGLRRWLGRRIAAAAQVEARTRHAAWSATIVAALGVIAALQHQSGQRPLDIGFDPTRMPVAATDYLRAHPLPGNGFSNQSWGGYLLYRLWPETRVFFDGQTIHYGEELTRRYVQIVTMEEGWEETLDRYRVSWIIFDTDSALVRRLKQSSPWHVVYEDPLATILVRERLPDPPDGQRAGTIAPGTPA